MNPKTNEPIYLQIAKTIKEDILSGKYTPNDTLPSENELAQKYATTRTTVRRSLTLLENDGFIRVWAGKGYFVSEPDHDIFTFQYSERSKGTETIKNVTVLRPDAFLMKKMNIPANKKVIKIARVISNTERPYSYEVKYLPYDKGVPVLENEMKYEVFPKIAAYKTSAFAFSTQMQILAVLPTNEILDNIHCDPFEPLLKLCRIFRDQNNVCIGYGEQYFISKDFSLCASSGYLK